MLPPGHNKQQKVAVGDSSGVLQCFSIKKGDTVAAFKTLPAAPGVSHITVGKGATQRDKVFVAGGQVVRVLMMHC